MKVLKFSFLLYLQALLSAMEKADVRPDIDFYNMLIKKRSLRFDYKNSHVSVLLTWTSKTHKSYFPAANLVLLFAQW